MMHKKAAATVQRSGPPPWILALGFVIFPAPLFALISLSFQSVPGYVSLTGAGTPIASGVTRTVGASDYTISTAFGVRVIKIISLSSNYTLQARLQSAHALTWKVDGVTMSTTAATVATLQPYATTLTHTLDFVVPFSYAAGAVTTVFEVTAIAN
jgi:hypothetical protein